jgi:hypothetical protein
VRLVLYSLRPVLRLFVLHLFFYIQGVIQGLLCFCAQGNLTKQGGSSCARFLLTECWDFPAPSQRPFCSWNYSNSKLPQPYTTPLISLALLVVFSRRSQPPPQPTFYVSVLRGYTTKQGRIGPHPLPFGGFLRGGFESHVTRAGSFFFFLPSSLTFSLFPSLST